jgi:hypothetical protein
MFVGNPKTGVVLSLLVEIRLTCFISLQHSGRLTSPIDPEGAATPNAS